MSDKIDVQPIAKALNGNIRLSDYGIGVNRVYFTFIAVKPSNNLHENEVKFDKKSKTLELSLNLSYEHILTADKPTILKMMAMLFLVSVDLWERFEIEDFDRKAFKKEVEKLFAKKKWLETAQLDSH
ncbi:MAG: hypothetical protein R2830_00490 [Saprospiraceae bacterium]